MKLDNWHTRVSLQDEECVVCGSARPKLPMPDYRPCRLANRAAVHDYVRSLSAETHEWLLALYVDQGLNLLAVETVDLGSVGDVALDKCRVVLRGLQLRAAGFVLVHNHPSGFPEPSRADIGATRSLRMLAEDYDCHLLDHFIVAGDRMVSVGSW